MTLKELRLSKKITQQEASIICEIPLRSYKRLEGDSNYINSYKYQHAFNILESYINKKDINHEPYHILVIGAGYVGLSISILLSIYNDVDVVDIDINKVNKINNRDLLFKDIEINKYLSHKSLSIKGYLPDINLYKDKDYIIISIPTNYDETTKMLDTSGITSLVKEIRTINKKALIVIKSTCSVGFTDTLEDDNVIYCPEFLRENKALSDSLYPSRIIIGGDKTNKKVKTFASLLQEVCLNRPQILYMTHKETEAVKLFSNTYLALRVAYFNELDSFAIKNNIDSRNIIQGVSLDPRIGDYYNNPSFGFGGVCLPKDSLCLSNQMKDIDNNSILTSISSSNKTRKEYVVNDILSRLSNIDTPVVGVLPTKTRLSPILDVISMLENKGIKVIYYSSNEMTLDEFKDKCDLIITDRYNSSLDDIRDKIYTRDINIR